MREKRYGPIFNFSVSAFWRFSVSVMKFTLLDRIIELTPGESIRALKAVTASEEYLADHFPTFAVLPGVLMLEAMVEAAAWLVRVSQDFASSIVLLAEARNVTYKSFVRPGDVLEVGVTCRRLGPAESAFSGCGTCHGIEVVKAKFGLRHFSLADCAHQDPGRAEVDRKIVRQAREQLAALMGSQT